MVKSGLRICGCADVDIDKLELNFIFRLRVSVSIYLIDVIKLRIASVLTNNIRSPLFTHCLGLLARGLRVNDLSRA